MRLKFKFSFPKVKRVSLTEAAELEPHICLSGVGGALVAGVNICHKLQIDWFSTWPQSTRF